jgi:transglutaminase-like putative cysteine protease
MTKRLCGYPQGRKRQLLSWLRILLIGILLLSFSSYLLLSRPPLIVSEEKVTGRSFILKVTLTLENNSPEGRVWNLSETERTISLFMNNSRQTVYLLNVSYPVDGVRFDADGNPVAVLSLPKQVILNGENLTLQIAYRIVIKPHSLSPVSVNRSGTLDEISQELRMRYCVADGPWQTSIEELRETAFRIAGNETNVLSLVKRFIQWIKHNVYYESQGIPQYPIETLSVKAGDCDDQANLLIAFCRIVGIPAYLQIGFIYLPWRDSMITYWDGHMILRLTRIGWHGWAVIYVPPWGWIPVDLTYASGAASDPLNAIRNAAVTAYAVAQYANITESDYIALSRGYRDFLVSNGFRIYEHDSLYEEKPLERKSYRLPRLYTSIRLHVYLRRAAHP